MTINDLNDQVLAAVEALNTSDSLGLKSVKMYVQKYNTKQIKEFFIAAPFVLLHYIGVHPVESERLQDGRLGIEQDRWLMYIGTQDLASSEASERDVLSLYSDLREIVDGGRITVEGKVFTLRMIGGGPFDFEAGVTVYYYEFGIYRIN